MLKSTIGDVGLLASRVGAASGQKNGLERRLIFALLLVLVVLLLVAAPVPRGINSTKKSETIKLRFTSSLTLFNSSVKVLRKGCFLYLFPKRILINPLITWSFRQSKVSTISVLNQQCI